MSKGKILVVDDSASIVALIKALLEAEDYEVITAADGQEGLRLAQENSPNLIILDVMLPKMDGYTVCRLIKSQARFADIPVIMLTARAGEADQKLSRESKADVYLTKPIDEKLLLQKISERIKK